MAANYNMVVNQGEDFIIKLLIKDESGVPVDISNDTFQGQIRERYDSPNVAASFSFEFGQNTGEVYVKLSNTVTAAIPVQASSQSNKRPSTEFVYDIEQTKSGIKTRILEGIVAVSANVTK